MKQAKEKETRKKPFFYCGQLNQSGDQLRLIVIKIMQEVHPGTSQNPNSFISLYSLRVIKPQCFYKAFRCFFLCLTVFIDFGSAAKFIDQDTIAQYNIPTMPLQQPVCILAIGEGPIGAGIVTNAHHL